MKNASACRRTRRVFAMTPLALALSLAGGSALAASQTYTFDSDFALGSLTGVNYTIVPNQLQLNVTGSSFPVLWIANAGEDTLSKIDSKQIGASPGREIARYRTWFNAGAHAHDAWNGAAPSRTAVDKDGNAYVADRGFQSAGYPGWAYVFKILNDTYIDRNASGTVDTSTDTNADGSIQVGEMKALVDSNANSIIDPAEIQDERIAWAVRVPDGVYTGTGTTPIAPRQNALARALCIGTDGNLWVGMYNSNEYWKISAVDGHTIAGPVPAASHNYGCLIDQNGTLWGANWADGTLTRIDNTASNTGPYPYTPILMPNAVYGLALRRDAANVTHVIMGGSGNSYVEYNAGTNAWSKPAAINYSTYAVGTDNEGNILVSKQTGGVVKFNPSGGVIWDKGSQVGSSDSRGVIADADNNIWQVHRGTNNIAKYRGTDGAFLGVFPVGYEPYTYSDASGTAQLSITTKTGNWSVVKDGGAAGTKWAKMSWNANTPTGASVTGEARSADTMGGLSSAIFQPMTSGGAMGLTGRYVELKVTLNANPQNLSPVVYDVTVATASVARCDIDKDGDIDQKDLSLISRARGQKVTGADDPLDADGDGLITPNDVKVCIPKCTRANCAIQ
jgi:hypothetical protein